MRIEKRHCYKRKVWYYNRCNYDDFRREINEHDCDHCFSSDNVNEACSKWTDDFMSIANKHIPNQIVTIRPNDVPWYNSRLRKLKRIRDRSYSYAKRHSNSRSWETYRANRNKYNYELRAAEDEYYNTLAHKLLPDNKMAHKKWWQTVKSFLGKYSDNDTPPPPLLTMGKRSISQTMTKPRLLITSF